jgi:hypothetical protein
MNHTTHTNTLCGQNAEFLVLNSADLNDKNTITKTRTGRTIVFIATPASPDPFDLLSAARIVLSFVSLK